MGALLAVAAVNAIYTRPALAREAALARASGVPAPGAVAVLEAVSGVVEVLMMGVLLVSGALTQLPPAREAFAEATRGTFRDVTADGLGSPVQIGMNLLKLLLVAFAAYSAVHSRIGQIVTAQQLTFLQIFGMGSQIVKLLPTPTVLSMSSRPPC